MPSLRCRLLGKYSAYKEVWIRRKPGMRTNFDTRIFSAAKSGAIVFGVEKNCKWIVCMKNNVWIYHLVEGVSLERLMLNSD
jgi:hypothetical protein